MSPTTVDTAAMMDMADSVATEGMGDTVVTEEDTITMAGMVRRTATQLLQLPRLPPSANLYGDSPSFQLVHL